MMHEMVLTLKFDTYIAHPYWPEREELVNLQKSSGINRARSEDKRDKALMNYLEKQGLGLEYYQRLQKLAAREWYRLDGDDSEIIIPRHQLSGTLVQACKSAPAGARFDDESLRSLVQLSDLKTGKKAADEVFRRFVLPKDGKGNPLSNQRALRTNEVIRNFEASGTIRFDTNDVKQKSLESLLSYAGKYVGCGSSRKMGYGRFELLGLE